MDVGENEKKKILLNKNRNDDTERGSGSKGELRQRRVMQRGGCEAGREGGKSVQGRIGPM